MPLEYAVSDIAALDMDATLFDFSVRLAAANRALRRSLRGTPAPEFRGTVADADGQALRLTLADGSQRSVPLTERRLAQLLASSAPTAASSPSPSARASPAPPTTTR